MLFAMELGTHRFFSSRASPFSAGVLEGIGIGFLVMLLWVVKVEELYAALTIEATPRFRSK